MTRLNSEELDEIIKTRMEGQRVVRAEADDADSFDDEVSEDVDYDTHGASIDKLRSKLSSYFEDDALMASDNISQTVDDSAQFVVVEPDDETAADRTAPLQRATIVSSDTHDIIAEQG